MTDDEKADAAAREAIRPPFGFAIPAESPAAIADGDLAEILDLFTPEAHPSLTSVWSSTKGSGPVTGEDLRRAFDAATRRNA